MREIHSVYKDHNGFIWASSKTGILRLTEDDYRIYQLPFEKTNFIGINIACRDSLLLVYTSNGQIFVYNEVLDRFERLINIQNAMNSLFMSTNSVLIAGDKSLWISTSWGLCKYQDNQIVFTEDKRRDIQRLEWYSDDEIIFSSGNELFTYNIRSKQTVPIDPVGNEIGSAVSKLLMDPFRQVLWIGTMSDGLYFYDFNRKRLAKFAVKAFPRQPILSLEFNYDSTLFVGIDGQGIWQLDVNEPRVIYVYKENINDPWSLRGNGVYDIYREKNNRVWVCTYSNGLSYFDQASPFVEQVTHQINNPNSLINNDVNCVIKDRKGRLWLATNNGISCWDIAGDKWKHFYTNKQEQAQVFLTLCEDNQGRIWAGTYSSGLYIIDGDTGSELHHYSSKVPGSPITNDFVFDIYRDRVGDIWIGGVRTEVTRYKYRENQFQKYGVHPMYVFADYLQGQMLMGCTYGLSVTDKEADNSRIIFNGAIVQDLLVTDSIVWICTGGDGLIRFHPSTDERIQYTTTIGFPSNFINSIEQVDEYFWLGTENGLCRFNPADLSVLTYSSIQSLSNLSFNRNAVCRLNDGQLAWGSNNGVILFDPNTIRETAHKGRIFIQDLSIAGRSVRDIPSLKLKKPVDKLDEITLKYNQNTLTLELLPIGVAPGSKFSWKMEGLDENWSIPSNNRIITFSNIKSKDFRLFIRLYDSSLSNIIDERSLAIKLTPPFWVTWYFFVIVFIFITVLLYLSVWYYINMLKQRHTEEKVRFFTNTAHDLRTSLTLIKAPVEELTKEPQLSDSGHHYLQLATEQVGRLSSVVTQLMEFQKTDIGKGQVSLAMVDVAGFIRLRLQMFESLARSRTIELVFSSNLPEYRTAIDETLMEKVIDNLVSNAVKYSHNNGTVRLDLNCTESKWTLEVKDQGIGISKTAQQQLFREFYRGGNAINSKIVGSGIGLLLVKNYVNLHGGQISYTSHENAGSVFQITMPYKEVVEETSQRYNRQSDEWVSGGDEPADDKSGDPTSKAMRIMLVEDNDDLLHFMEYALGKEFEVQTADNGARAWEIIRKQLPDIVVSDVLMPGMGGFELCQVVKSTFETSHIPFVLLTALSGKAEQLQGLGLGADDYLTKPFDMTLLKQKIRTIIQNREAVKERALKLIKGNENEPILKNQLNNSFLKKMLEVVQENIANSGFGKDEFASAMNVSKSLLYKKIKALTDQSPTDFIKDVRLDHALALIQAGKYSVTEVSELSGFSSVGYFCTVFKKHFGKSPTEI